MKTREYEFEGQRYRWIVTEYKTIGHQYQNSELTEGWGSTYAPATEYAASALAALIEDMQVQVIAEWDSNYYKYRARDTESGLIAEWWNAGGLQWEIAERSTAALRAGYEAGKAAR